MKKKHKIMVVLLLLMVIVSCKKETREKLKKAKQTISNTVTVVDKAKEAQKDIEKLKDMTPFTNEQLKKWLPESVNEMKRTGFKVGKTGYANISSVEGIYKLESGSKKFTLNIIDGAGSTGSMMVAGLEMVSKMNMEEEDENKHTKSVTINNIKAQQTFHKKRNETAIQFVYGKRFGVMVNGVKMEPEETWKLIKNIDLDGLVNMVK